MTTITLVTGANRGLGLATARRLAHTDHRVILGCRDLPAGQRAASQLRDEGLDVEAVQLDVDNPRSVAAAAAAVRERHGILDVLVNNAGVLPEFPGDADETVDTGLIARTLNTNVLGPARVAEAFLPLLRESADGRIVNVSSRMGSMGDQSSPDSRFPAPIVPGYRASKAALNSLTVSLAQLLADTPIKVNAVCPGFVRTDLTPANREFAPQDADAAAEVVARYALVGADGPSGAFHDADGVVPW